MSVSVIRIFRLIFDFIQQYVGTELTKMFATLRSYEGWNFNSGNYLFTTDTK